MLMKFIQTAEGWPPITSEVGEIYDILTVHFFI